MKKIVFLIVLALIGTVCFAQRGGGSHPSNGGRPSGGQPHTSTSVRHSSPSKSPARSTSTYRPTTRSVSNTTPNRLSTARSTHPTIKPTPSVGNAPRNQNRPVYRPAESNRQSVAPHRPPHHTPGHSPRPTPNHHPHHPHQPHYVPYGMHPAPPAYHPMHHRPIHMHYYGWYHWSVCGVCWNGYWSHFHTYPYNDIVVYVNSISPSTEVISVGSDDNYIYTLYRDALDGNTYFAISDENDNMVAKAEVHRKYCRLLVDDNGVWLFKKHDRSPIYFTYRGGNLYYYEED